MGYSSYIWHQNKFLTSSKIFKTAIPPPCWPSFLRVTKSSRGNDGFTRERHAGSRLYSCISLQAARFISPSRLNDVYTFYIRFRLFVSANKVAGIEPGQKKRPWTEHRDAKLKEKCKDDLSNLLNTDLVGLWKNRSNKYWPTKAMRITMLKQLKFSE